MSNATAEKKMIQVFAMWKNEGKNGKPYFTGKLEDGTKLTGFYNTDKKNMKEPDIRIYRQGADGKLEGEEYVSLWCNSTKDGKKKYLSGKVDGKRVVGFIREKATGKLPYFTVYWGDEDLPQAEAPKAEPKKEAPKKSAKKDEEVVDQDLPF